MTVSGTLATARVSALLVVVLLAGCRAPVNEVNARLDNEMPRKMLWAWERPEDLRFIDANTIGVAFLAQTITLSGDRVNVRKRRQPLDVPPGTYMIAVTRIETVKHEAERATFDDEMMKRTAAAVVSTLDLPDVRGLQTDFDAVVSERKFYRLLINEIRRTTPSDTPLTMTSLASWCTGDAWFNDFPVDEAVPMVFEMGADSDKIKNYLRNGNDWNEPLCLGSYGISLNEGLFDGMKDGRRMYYFKYSQWAVGDIENVK